VETDIQMPVERNESGQTADFIWRGLALIASIGITAIACKLETVPVGLMLAGGISWAFVGYKPRRPVLAACITSACAMAAGLVIWSLPLKIGIFIPIWAVLWISPPWVRWIFKRACILAIWLWSSRGKPLVFVDSSLTASERFPRLSECVRVAVSMIGPFAAIGPFLHRGIMGGDDARWYTAVVADNLSQWRSGMGPAFVGQTYYAAFGTVLPLRVAPYLQHLTLLFDYMSGQRYPAYILVNLAIVFSSMAGGLSAYLCLRSILPDRRTEACLLAVLYSWCPAVIGLAYNGQLFMSAMTLPYLPIVFLGVIRLYDRESLSGWLMMSAGCAMTWLCHSPIGLWATIAAALAVTVRWSSGHFCRREMYLALFAAAAFAVLCGYVFVSIATLSPDTTAPIAASEVIATIHRTVPGIFLPLSPTGSALSDFQPGYGLWIILGLCLYEGPWRGRGPSRALAAITVLLLVLLLPIPGLNDRLWHLVPQSVIDATNRAAGQRLYTLLAACIVILAGIVLKQHYESGASRRSPVVLILLLATLWSGIELRPFLARGALLANSAPSSDESLSPQNLALSRYSIGFLSEHNRFYSSGVVDYNLEQRILGPNLRTYITTNVDEIAPGYDGGPRTGGGGLAGQFLGQGDPIDGHFVVLSPKLRIEPSKHYLLAIDFPKNEYAGVLEIKGKGFHREYSLPMSGEPFAFGATRFASRSIPLSTGAHDPVDLTLTFINQGPDADAGPYRNFARFNLIRYDPERLPIRLRSFLPYTADVRSPGPGWLETFRYYTPGWEAEVDGRSVPVRRSWNQLVAVPVGAGESHVKLFYRPSVALVASYWATWVGWLALLAVSIVWLLSARRHASDKITGTSAD
jgi:hypothetical protein